CKLRKVTLKVPNLRHALQRQKTHFDNVNIDWNLSHDEAAGAKLVIETTSGTFDKSIGGRHISGPGSLQPPPPAPSPSQGVRLSNGRSTESMSSDLESTSSLHNPVPPPRKPTSATMNSSTGMVGLRRCRASYDCDADNEDELTFREGEVIIVIKDQTDDYCWMEGVKVEEKIEHQTLDFVNKAVARRNSFRPTLDIEIGLYFVLLTFNANQFLCSQ
ncbi:hypothetical protein C0J52_27383, partial [Blattella germanica]